MSHGHDDFEREPIPGLPKHLPEGEKILWQGSPDKRAVMLRVFHVRKFALYAAAMVGWRGVTVVYDGGSLVDGIVAAGILAAVCTFAIGILAFFARQVSSGTIYTITNNRLIMRFGIALPMTVQIPFSKIAKAAVNLRGDGTGDIALSITERGKISYIVMWPHVRPWRMTRPQPLLRALPDARSAAEILRKALDAALAKELPTTEADVQVAARTSAKAVKIDEESKHTPGQWAAAAG